MLLERNFPTVGLGCAFFPAEIGGEEKVIKIVEEAIDIGYRLFDTAASYCSEACIGTAIRNKISAGVVQRDDIIVTTKVWGTHARREKTIESATNSVKQLGLDHIDLLLIHWPVALQYSPQPKIPVDDDDNALFDDDVDYLETWAALEECVSMGLVKNIGVSNFSIEQLTRLMKHSKIKPSCNQVEVNIYFQNVDLVKFCQQNGIQVVGYSPYGKGGRGGTGGRNYRKLFNEAMMCECVFDDETLKAIAKRYDATVGQIVLQFQIQRSIAVIPKSTNATRMRENFELKFKLSQDDMDAISSLG